MNEASMGGLGGSFSLVSGPSPGILGPPGLAPKRVGFLAVIKPMTTTRRHYTTATFAGNNNGYGTVFSAMAVAV
jgi:hypothetical protein